MTWRVTHIDQAGHRHRLSVTASSNALAIAWALQLWGEPRALHVIRLPSSLRRPAA